MLNTKRGRIRAVSFLSALLLVLGGLAYAGHARATAYRRLLSNTYQHAFFELSSAAEELSTALKKACYSNCVHDLGVLYSQIYAKALTAQMSIGELPYGSVELENTSAFFARAGDYAAAMARTKQVCTAEERGTLRELSSAADFLAAALRDLQSDVLGGTTDIDDVLTATQRLSRRAEGVVAGAASAFQSVENEFPEVPTLIYDGPFSDHLTDRAPRGLEGMDEVTREEARARAASFLGLRPEIFTFSSDGGGVLPMYSFAATVDGGEVYIQVSKQGGQIINFFNSRAVGEAAITPEQAILLAQNHFAAWGYPLMRESYYINDFNVLTINFATMQDDVYCYPDLVEVSIALDNGRLLGVHAEGYWMNHALRDIPASVLTREAAQAKVLPDLEVLAWQLALIPTAGEHEVLTHEFKCKTPEGSHILVYINAETGQEQKILLLLEDETGTLVL